MVTVFNQSLWGDEAFSAVLSTNSVAKIIEIITRDTSPPLYNLILHYWYQIAGTSETAIRALSLVFFLLTIFFVYQIGALLWNKTTGLLAALLTTFNPFFFTYAFEGRMYSILALGVTASMYFFLKQNWLGYVLATTWALYSHHFALFALVIQGLWFVYELVAGKKTTAIKMVKSFIAVGILYLPWILPLYKQTRMVGGGFWLDTPTLIDLRNLIYKYLAEGIRFKNFAKIALYLALALLILRRWQNNLKKTVFLLTWFAGPILLTWLVSQKFQSIFFDRYLLYTIPAGMLLLSSGRRKISLFLTGWLFISFLVIDGNYFFHPAKRPFRDLANYTRKELNQNPKDSTLLINWNSAAHHLWESKYYQIPAPIYLPSGSLPYYVGTAQMTAQDILSAIPKNTTKIGAITSSSPEEIVIPNFTKIEVKSFRELAIVWLQRKK